MKHRIAIILPFFGKLPIYAPLFFESIKDKEFDLFVFTDVKQQTNYVSKNIYWHITDLHKLKKQFSLKLGVTVSLENPYKLCDYKPAYGFLFQETIPAYDFWGVIDLDTVMGNFIQFINDQRLSQIDFYSGINEYVSGSFFLVRNNTYCNQLFKKSKDWIEVFTVSTYVHFDECGGHFFDVLKYGEDIFNLSTLYQSFTEVIFREEKSNNLRTLFTNEILEMSGLTPAYVSQKGLHYMGENYLMLHYIFLKRNSMFSVNIRKVSAVNYYINSFGSFTHKPTRARILFSRNLVRGLIDKICQRLNC